MAKVIEFLYESPSGRKEVRYRRLEGTLEAQELMIEVDRMVRNQGKDCPYSYQLVFEDEIIQNEKTYTWK